MNSVSKLWFSRWQEGDVENIPLTDNFVHKSPYGAIQGKQAYLDIVNANRDMFLNHRFEIHDVILEADKCCIRYTAIQGDFKLDVTEWHYYAADLISEIVAYYNIEGEISEDRKLKDL